MKSSAICGTNRVRLLCWPTATNAGHGGCRQDEHCPACGGCMPLSWSLWTESSDTHLHPPAAAGLTCQWPRDHGGLGAVQVGLPGRGHLAELGAFSCGVDLFCGAHGSATDTCRSCRPQSEALLASLGRDQAGSQPAVSSSGTSSESADCRGRKMKRQASRLPVPRGRPRDPAGFQVTPWPINQIGGSANDLADSAGAVMSAAPLAQGRQVAGPHCPHVVRLKAASRLTSAAAPAGAGRALSRGSDSSIAPGALHAGPRGCRA